MWLGERAGNRIVVYTPAGDASAAKIENLPAMKPQPLA
jgi:hypothetical protein